jgi:hypothetical protein
MLNQISIWLRKATVSGSVHEANALSGVGEKGGARISLEGLDDVSGKVGKGRAWVQCWEL